MDSIEYRELKGQLHTAENTLAKRLLQRERQQDLLLAAEQRAEELQAEKASVLAQVRRALAGLQADAGKLGDSVALRRHGDRLMADLRSLRGKASRARRALAKLDALIAPLKQQTAELETRLPAAIRNQSRLQLLIDNHNPPPTRAFRLSWGYVQRGEVWRPCGRSS